MADKNRIKQWIERKQIFFLEKKEFLSKIKGLIVEKTIGPLVLFFGVYLVIFSYFFIME